MSLHTASHCLGSIRCAQTSAFWHYALFVCPKTDPGGKLLPEGYTNGGGCKGEGKGLDTGYSAAYTSTLKTSSALQSHKWQLIGMS